MAAPFIYLSDDLEPSNYKKKDKRIRLAEAAAGLQGEKMKL